MKGSLTRGISTRDQRWMGSPVTAVGKRGKKNPKLARLVGIFPEPVQIQYCYKKAGSNAQKRSTKRLSSIDSEGG